MTQSGTFLQILQASNFYGCKKPITLLPTVLLGGNWQLYISFSFFLDFIFIFCLGQAAASDVGRKVAVMRQAGAACDHPIDPSYPEGAYLSNVLLRVLWASITTPSNQPQNQWIPTYALIEVDWMWAKDCSYERVGESYNVRCGPLLERSFRHSFYV